MTGTMTEHPVEVASCASERKLVRTASGAVAIETHVGDHAQRDGYNKENGS